jgi:catechol 2,3-dioxygenase-like lactoylglutathione lyase family enzyme
MTGLGVLHTATWVEGATLPTTVNHIGLTVADLDRSVTFYKLLGFEEGGPQNLEIMAQDWLPEIVGLRPVDMIVSYLSFGPVTLELLQYLQPHGRQTTPLGVNDAGSAHIGLEVEDVRAEYGRLCEAGVRFKGPPVTIPDGEHGFGGVTSVYGYDPDGNCFEMQTFPWTATS